jgi:hypothetical protein
MKYYLYIVDTGKKIECSKEILQLNKFDHVYNSGVMYEVENKYIDYDEKLIDINVHIDN